MIAHFVIMIVRMEVRAIPKNEIEAHEMTHDKNQIESDTPEKCPLRNGDIIVTIKKQL